MNAYTVILKFDPDTPGNISYPDKQPKYNIKYDKFQEYANIRKQLRDTTDPELQNYIKTVTVPKHDFQSFIIYEYQMVGDKFGYLLTDNTDRDLDACCSFADAGDTKTTKMYNKVMSTQYGKKIFEQMKSRDLCEREKLVNNLHIYRLYHLYDKLVEGGDYLFAIFNYCHHATIDILYLYAMVFEYVEIYMGDFIYCHNFKPKQFDRNILKSLTDNIFAITPKPTLDELCQKLNTWIKFLIKRDTLLLNKQMSKHLEMHYNWLLDVVNTRTTQHKSSIDYNRRIQEHLAKYYNRILIKSRIIKITHNITPINTRLLTDTIITKQISSCVQIGMAYAIASVFILANIQANGFLISIDPYQESKYNNGGLKIIKNFKYDNHFHYNRPTYHALPEILNKYGDESFDMIYINQPDERNVHELYMQFFYAHRLLKPNGILFIPDGDDPNIQQLIYMIKDMNKYIYEYEPDYYVSIAIFVKIST